MRSIGRMLSALLLVGLSACSSSQDVGEAQAGIRRFHAQLDAENYGAIWATTSPEMHRAAQQAQLVTFLSAVHRKLGKVTTSTQMGWNVNYNTAGTFTTVTQHTVFAQGTGDETFVFKSDKGQIQLVGYHINSMDMMTH
jgi:hypothetical protein